MLARRSARAIAPVATVALAALGAAGRPQTAGAQAVPSCTSSIRVLFNQFGQTRIPAGSTIWFSSVLEGIQSDAGKPITKPLRIDVRQSRITFGLWPYVINMPDSTIAIDPAAGAPQRWWIDDTSWSVTYAPPQIPEAFFDGMPYKAPEAFIPGYSGPVTWTATFTASRPGATVRWAWSAAAYSQFGANGRLLVKPLSVPVAEFRIPILRARPNSSSNTSSRVRWAAGRLITRARVARAHRLSRVRHPRPRRPRPCGPRSQFANQRASS